jgi:predicted GIY-YIG superfamily endonuclease
MQEYVYYVYIMTNFKGGTLYVGVTNDIAMRSTAHRNDKGAVLRPSIGCTDWSGMNPIAMFGRR